MMSRLLVVTMFYLSGCTTLSEIALQSKNVFDDSRLINGGGYQRSSSWVLGRETRFYIARNNQLTELNSVNSDKLTDAIYFALSQSFPLSYVALIPESFDQARAKARSLGTDFLVYPAISVWEDRMGGRLELLNASDEGSGVKKAKPDFGLDEVEVQLVIVHAASGDVFDLVKLDAQAGIITRYNHHPETILLPELQAFFANLAEAPG